MTTSTAAVVATEHTARAGSVTVADTRLPSTWRASLRAVYIIWYRDMLRFVRDRVRFATSLAMPVLYLGVFGTGLSSAMGGGFGVPGLKYIQYMFPGVIGMTVLMSGLMGAMSIVWDREFGFLKEVLVAPVHGAAVAVGKALGGATQATIQGVVILILAPLLGVALTPLGVVQLLVLIFLLAFAVSSLGVLISTRMKTMQGFQAVMNLLMMPMFFLSGALFLLNGLPGWMTALTRINPAAYGIDALRRVALTGAGLPNGAVDRLAMTFNGTTVPIAAEIAVLGCFGLAALGLAAWGFGARE
jgi:ABC-2 type transport system permease protein